ncbi:MAG TPA: biotin--[acetyl-CoA-carboxylase] ligase [Candidatus Nanoarchaeia archaeon]|nr:biotin--[acetyl-CoA-carboxylase] ligase [Candidatus Nanoarchaeia archaeon]
MSFKKIYFSQLDSTNKTAKELLQDGLVIVAGRQLRGRGRFRRSWSSSRGGLYCSITIATKDIEHSAHLTLAAAVAVRKALFKLYQLGTVIKWPNDILFEGKKLCGILSETYKKHVIVGIGINTNNRVILEKASNVSKLLGKHVDNDKLLDALLSYFGNYVYLYLHKKYSSIRADWKKYSFLGTYISVKTKTASYSGIAFDINKDCFLVIKDGPRKIVIREGDLVLGDDGK